MTHPTPNPSDAALFKAIRAQLSAAPLTLESAAPTFPDAETSDLESVAPRLADTYQAALVFWIEDRDPCEIFFFDPDDAGGQYVSRIIDIDLSNQSSRYDVIAVVAASMVEGFTVAKAPKPESQQPKRETSPPSAEAPGTTQTTRRWLEIELAYAGSLVASNRVSHGGSVGVGLFPLRHLFVAVSFSLYGPLTFSNDVLKIRLLSRQLEVLAAVRVFLPPVEIRLGAAYSADLRSYSTTALKETIRPRDDGYNAIHAVVPFLFAAWTHRERIGIFGNIGAHIAINETVFRLRLADKEPTEAFAPFNVKLVYKFGLLVLF